MPVSMASIVATPPKLRTPRTVQATVATARRTNKLKSELVGGRERGGVATGFDLRDVLRLYVVVFSAPFVLPLGVSPLVTVQRMTRPPVAERPHPPRFPTPEAGHPSCTPYRTPAARKVGVTPRPPMAPPLPPSSASPPLRSDGGVPCQVDDVASPEAARARCQAVRLDYGGVRNPATLGLRDRVMRNPLQRSALFSKGWFDFH